MIILCEYVSINVIYRACPSYLGFIYELKFKKLFAHSSEHIKLLWILRFEKN